MFMLALGLALLPSPALAEGVNPNLPPEEELELYALEGTLDERIALEESFLEEPSPMLLELMGEGDGVASEFERRGTMPRTGTARMLALRPARPQGRRGQPPLI